jgi:hypothetical protein
MTVRTEEKTPGMEGIQRNSVALILQAPGTEFGTPGSEDRNSDHQTAEEVRKRIHTHTHTLSGL